jgi:hypothetical protein
MILRGAFQQPAHNIEEPITNPYHYPPFLSQSILVPRFVAGILQLSGKAPPM